MENNQSTAQLELTGSRPQGTALTETSSARTKPTNQARFKHIRELVNQSFDTFNSFGKSPEAVENIIKMFYTVLEDQELSDVTGAFKAWARDHSAMPTPADIRRIAVETRAARRKTGMSHDFPKPEWVQVIRDRKTDQEIATYGPGEHLSPMDVREKYGSDARESMRRA